MANDWRNAMIEEIEALLVDAPIIDFVDGGVLQGPRQLAQDLVAVFEKALGEPTVTPTAHEVTTDEREALGRILESWAGPWMDSQRPALYDLLVAAGFRRSEVPEPSRDPGWSHPEAVYSPEVFMAIQGLLDEARGEPMHALRLAVSRQQSALQSEPSGAQVDTVAAAIAVAADADYWTDEIAQWEGAEAWYREAYPNEHPHTAYEDREQFRKQARAALRAAGVVR